MSLKYKHSAHTAEEWVSAPINDPIIVPNEIVIEKDKNQLKIGDGVKKYSELPYYVDVKQGTSYIMVYGVGTPEENAAELQAAYDEAVLKEPDLNNPITLVVAPGYYDFGLSTFTIDYDFIINIVSLTGARDVLISKFFIAVQGGYFKGIHGVNLFSIENGIDITCENCIGGNGAFSSGEMLSGTYINCEGKNNSFCADMELYATIINCIGGAGSFTIQGGLIKCIIKNSTGGLGSFGSAVGNDDITIDADTRFYNCHLTSGVFKTPALGGKLVLCIDGNDAIITTA